MGQAQLFNPAAQIKGYTGGGGGASVGQDFTGYIPTGLGTNDDGPAIQACIDAMPAYGGKLLLPNGQIKVNTQVNVNKRISLMGHGHHDNRFYSAATEILTEANGIPAFKLTKEGTHFHGVGFYSDMHLRSITPTATSNAVLVDIQTPIDYVRRPDYSVLPQAMKDRGTLPGSVKFTECSFWGFYDNLKVINAQESRVLDCRFGAAVNLAMHYENAINHDGGDSVVSDCDFYSLIWNSEAAIKQFSGGGLKLSNNKFNGGAGKRYKKHYWSVMDGATTILLFNNNSFENFSEAGIWIDGTNFKMVKIEGNQFAPYNASTHMCKVKNTYALMIKDNIFRRNGTDLHTAIQLHDCVDVLIGPNMYFGWESSGTPKDLVRTTRLRDLDFEDRLVTTT